MNANLLGDGHIVSGVGSIHEAVIVVLVGDQSTGELAVINPDVCALLSVDQELVRVLPLTQAQLAHLNLETVASRGKDVG